MSTFSCFKANIRNITKCVGVHCAEQQFPGGVYKPAIEIFTHSWSTLPCVNMVQRAAMAQLLLTPGFLLQKAKEIYIYKTSNGSPYQKWTESYRTSCRLEKNILSIFDKYFVNISLGKIIYIGKL